MYYWKGGTVPPVRRRRSGTPKGRSSPVLAEKSELDDLVRHTVCGYHALDREGVCVVNERAAERRPRTPIVGDTANARKDSRDLCLTAGMDDVLIKPGPTTSRRPTCLTNHWPRSTFASCLT
jgi:hypothetical protein